MTAKTVDELIHIAASGGGVMLRVGDLGVEDLTRIAAAAAGTGARIHLREGLSTLATNDCIRIAAAGRGAVIFE